MDVRKIQVWMFKGRVRKCARGYNEYLICV